MNAGEAADNPATPSRRVSRRAFLQGSGALGIALFVPFGRAGAAVAVTVEDSPIFLTPDELETLRALVDRFVPGPPEDPDPGAVEAGCAEAIDALLGAFLVDPPRIYAGAPFSDRGGWPTNHFEEFLPLDDYEETAWRLRIEGSGGRPELEFNGPVRGLQEIYREGLAALDAASPGGDFAAVPGPLRDLVMRMGDAAVDRLVDVAFVHTLEFMYGAPEYGGNRDLVGWEYTRWMGDVQPRGWTRDEVENPDDPGPADLLRTLPAGMTEDDLLAIATLVSPEVARGFIARSGGSLSALQTEVTTILSGVRRSTEGADGG